MSVTRAARVPYEPGYTTSPGEHLLDELRRLGISQADLAARTGLSAKHINQMTKGAATVTPETAVQLDLATGTPARQWLTYEANYRSHLATAAARSKLKEWYTWLSHFDLPELYKHNILNRSDPKERQVELLLRFFGISNPSGWTRVWEPRFTSFRRSPAFEPSQSATTVWLRIGQLKALDLQTGTYDANRLRDLLPSLRRLTQADPPESLAKLPELLRPAGVALVYAAELKGCRASGASWWASPRKAVILLSNRGKREDRFWFSLFHEIGHVLLHTKRNTFLDQQPNDEEGWPTWQPPEPIGVPGDTSVSDNNTWLERQADKFAADALVPPRYAHHIEGIHSDDDIRRSARALGISPGIVAGRWQHDHEDFTKYNGFRRHLPERPFVEPQPMELVQHSKIS